MPDLGDEGVRVLIDTGLIRCLEMLDLRHGVSTDTGAHTLVRAIPGGWLRHLDLQRNRLTDTGIAALTALKLPTFRVEYQQQPNEAGAYNDQYLYDSDWE